jgi:predicted restriction endonuclease
VLPDPQTSRAVLIGTSEYTQLHDLPGVEENLKAFSGILQDRFLCGLPPEHCELVRNPTTPGEMVDPVAEFAHEAADVLLVYFAGHGLLHANTGELYLACPDSDSRSIHKAVPYGYIRDQFRESSARRKIVILDCCYSGKALNTAMAAPDAASRFADNAMLSGTYLMVASAENKQANAGDIYTAFSGQLIELIQNGIPEEPDLLSLDALFKAARAALDDQGMPVPQRREKYHGGDVSIFRNRARSKQQDRPRYGHVPGSRPENWFVNRRALSEAGIHRPFQAGICGTVSQGGAESIVLSGGYKDDKDHGDVIIYTGHGGRDPDTNAQVQDQTLKHSGNAALVKNMVTSMPVRVIRGAGGDPAHSPSSGYTYDGQYNVAECWLKTSLDGPKVWQYRLEKVDEKAPTEGNHRRSRALLDGRWRQVAPGEYSDRSLAQQLERIYRHACQICDEVFEVPGGIRFASVVHIRGIELPHRGPDSMDNMLCLCSNHRDLFKYGAITIEDNFTLINQTDGEEYGELTVKHAINLDHVRYHRSLHSLDPWTRRGERL